MDTLRTLATRDTLDTLGTGLRDATDHSTGPPFPPQRYPRITAPNDQR